MLCTAIGGLPVTEISYRRDLEEALDTDGVLDAEPINFWEAKQRELVSSVVDYSCYFYSRHAGLYPGEKT
jgi:hypothetical protein